MSSNSQLIVSSAFFGPVAYFAQLIRHSEVMVEAYEHYPKQTYRNRSVIMTANGVIPLIVPVVKTNGNHTLLKDIRLADHNKWLKLHWRTIDSAYSNAPFYLYYKDEIQPFFSGDFLNLLEYNIKNTHSILSLIGCGTKLIPTSEFVKTYPSKVRDLRYSFSPKIKVDGVFPDYFQVFSDRHGFKENLSILDLLFNLGPETLQYLQSIEV